MKMKQRCTSNYKMEQILLNHKITALFHFVFLTRNKIKNLSCEGKQQTCQKVHFLFNEQLTILKINLFSFSMFNNL